MTTLIGKKTIILLALAVLVSCQSANQFLPKSPILESSVETSIALTSMLNNLMGLTPFANGDRSGSEENGVVVGDFRKCVAKLFSVTTLIYDTYNDWKEKGDREEFIHNLLEIYDEAKEAIELCSGVF